MHRTLFAKTLFALPQSLATADLTRINKDIGVDGVLIPEGEDSMIPDVTKGLFDFSPAKAPSAGDEDCVVGKG